MSLKTRFGVIVSDKVAEVHEHDVADLGPDEVLIENKSNNICTTDYQQWMGLRPHQPSPMAFGHENSGVVKEVGSGVTTVTPGDHVVLNIYGPCMECPDCRQGRNSIYCQYATVKKIKEKNAHGYHGFYGCSQYQIGKSKHVFKIDPDLPFECGGFAEPVSTVIFGMKRLNLRIGDQVLVIGAGTMGNLNAQVARYFGADVTISDLSDKKLEAAAKVGFEKTLNATDSDYMNKVKRLTGGAGFDAIIIAVGATQAYNQAIELVADDGSLLIFAAGYPPPAWNLEPNPVHYKLWRVIGTFGCGVADYHEAVTLLGQRKIDVSPLIEDRIPLADIQLAFEKAATPEQFRVSVMI